jgi:hypothetical protein
MAKRRHLSKPNAGATYERARRLANLAVWSIDLQCRRLRSAEPEDSTFVLRRWADFGFLVVSLIRLRRAAQLAASLPNVQPLILPAIECFDAALPGLKAMRDVAEHIDDYALDCGRIPTIPPQSLEVSTLEERGPTLHWLDTLNAREALHVSQRLFAAIRDSSEAIVRSEVLS